MQRVSMIVHLDSLNVMSYVTVVHNYIYEPHEVSIGNSIVISRPYSDFANCPVMFLLIPRLHFQLSGFLSLLIWSSLFSLSLFFKTKKLIEYWPVTLQTISYFRPEVLCSCIHNYQCFPLLFYTASS